MKINILTFINEDVYEAEQALGTADCHNIVALCRAYLAMLDNQRKKLYTLSSIPELTLQQPSGLARELAQQVRTAILAAVADNISEYNKTESLLKSFIEISGGQAVQTLNQFNYKGFDDWELQDASVRRAGGNESEFIALPKAVRIAGLLRRAAYIERNVLS